MAKPDAGDYFYSLFSIPSRVILSLRPGLGHRWGGPITVGTYQHIGSIIDISMPVQVIKSRDCKRSGTSEMKFFSFILYQGIKYLVITICDARAYKSTENGEMLRVGHVYYVEDL